MTYDFRSVVAIGRASITFQEALAIFGLSSITDPETLKKMYRVKSLEAHPDRGGSMEQMSKVNSAYDILIGKVKPAPSTTYDYRAPNQTLSNHRKRISLAQTLNLSVRTPHVLRLNSPTRTAIWK